jgi:hypothetical protein
MSPGIGSSTAQSKDHELVKRILAEFSNYHMHGGMFTHDDSMQVTLPTALADVVSTGWNAGDSTGAGYVVVDAANGTITIGDKGAGRYQFNAGCSFSSDKANVEIHISIYINGAKQLKLASRRSIGTANDIGYAGVPSLTEFLSPGDVVDLRWSSDANNTVLDIEHGGWGIIWMAGE